MVIGLKGEDMLEYQMEFIDSLGETDASWEPIFNISLPKKSTTTVEIVTLCGGGSTGPQHQIQIK